MKLGRMRYRAEFQRYKSSKDKDGFVTKEWHTAFCVWVDITAVSAREYLAASTETAETTVKIYARYNPYIDNTMRVKCGENCYEITSVIQNPREGITTIMGKEWDNGKMQNRNARGNAPETVETRERH